MAAVVDRCTCSKLTFEQMRAEAQRLNARSVKRLRHHLPMGAYCTACRPYVQRMLETGQTVFEVDPDAFT